MCCEPYEAGKRSNFGLISLSKPFASLNDNRKSIGAEKTRMESGWNGASAETGGKSDSDKRVP